MSNRFTVPDISDFSPPSTPDRSSRIGGRQWFGDEPSTTPAGPPPSSIASFTPAGAPTVSFLGSSIMRSVTGPKQPSFVQSNPGNASKNLFQRDSARTPKGLFAAKESTASNLFANSSNPPLGRSIEPLNSRRPSNLSKQFFASEGEEEDDEMQREMDNAQKKPGTFALPYSDEETEHEETRTEEEEEEPKLELDEDLMEEDDHDFLLDLPPVPGVDEAFADNEDDLIQATFHANERVLHEAENLYHMSSRIPGLNVHREFMFARTAKEMHDETDPATLRENDDLILKTEELVSRIYDEGVGATDDAEKLDLALAHASSQLCRIWQEHLHSINGQITERTGAIGPGAEADPFQKACWLGGLALHIHHMRVTDDGGEQVVPSLPEIMVDWMMRDHNVFSSAQLQEIGRCRPSPACHTLFWPSIINAIARGNLITSLQLLNDAGFDNVRTAGTRGDYMYTGQALQNLHHAVQITVDMLKSCPGLSNNWHVFGSEWTLFRHKAKNAREQLVRFAEGIDRARNLAGSHFEEPDNTMTYRAREAEGKVPWDVYKQLQTIFDITLGKANAILEASEDWVEASVALLVWLDEGREAGNTGLGQSVGMFKSVQPAAPGASSEAYSERLAQCFHVAVDEFPVNIMDVDEITYTCAFEANWEGVVAGLRMWSLPVACAVAEIASLGGWLPRPEPRLIAMESMDQEVMEVLGMESKGPDEVEGLKDVTIVDYAKELAGIKHMQATVDGQRVVREGWELAVGVLGRMDSRAKSEDMVRQLLQNVLQDITLDSGATIDKVWVLMNQLGMLNFAEEAVESYADLLAQESHRYGEALWYYALGHRINKVREVLNLLISYSLIQSTAFPPASDLDDHLDRLLTKRNATLEQLAKVDLEAAELLGKMLAGYATLRKFYDLRDNTPGALAIPDLSVFPFSQAQRAPSRRQQAAAALVAVIASSDDNIRGGLYDSTRDAVVSEDFLLALLGEALVFLKPQSGGARPASDDDTDEPDLTLEQLDVLFKAVEDIETVGSRVYAAADEFFQLVLASAPGLLKGSNPLDLMKKSTSGLSGTSSYVMSGSSMLASQLHRSFSGGSAALGKAGVTNTKRGWDWRQGMLAHTGAKDVLRMLRLGLSREVARLWLVQADGVII